MMRESMRRLASEEREVERRGAGERAVLVELLDGELLHIQIPRKAKGLELLEAVCARLGAAESDYFGLLRAERGEPRVWIDLNKRLAKTFKNEAWEAQFAVRFYPAAPAELRDLTTRRLVQLAVRRDICENRLQCAASTQALVASLVLQAELGDRARRVSADQLLALRAVPEHALDPDLEERVDELYEKHRGVSGCAAEGALLGAAARLARYGRALHAARDASLAPILLAVGAAGIDVYRDDLLLNRFPWAKILKISYDKRVFTLKLRPSEFDEWQTSVSFHLASTTAAKRLWICSVDHHVFFRRAEPVCGGGGGTLRLSRGASCRRTLRQLRAAPPAPATAASPGA